MYLVHPQVRMTDVVIMMTLGPVHIQRQGTCTVPHRDRLSDCQMPVPDEPPKVLYDYCTCQILGVPGSSSGGAKVPA
jgi:hypothetical protein